ncbi:hypothetical protein F3P66_24210 (plasmid) [Agrobacterium fabrum]|uniref:Uncharacterized protein n=1 Tax=Agrobacterium fabrum (strain C58 / ATCC 33970) TaxID=176299 RepID=Q8U5R4_AGRFC|nr:hypothetical protein Atu5519 [Agrobacterium fabrum str. C58]QRM62515.1 hypothetical protein F3P66_24210 [Agrobacterium fabrum]TRB28274.1 hypothetical protein EXN51_16730 [Agrobacterium fabrum]
MISLVIMIAACDVANVHPVQNTLNGSTESRLKPVGMSRSSSAEVYSFAREGFRVNILSRLLFYFSSVPGKALRPKAFRLKIGSRRLPRHLFNLFHWFGRGS